MVPAVGQRPGGGWGGGVTGRKIGGKWHVKNAVEGAGAASWVICTFYCSNAGNLYIDIDIVSD